MKRICILLFAFSFVVCATVYASVKYAGGDISLLTKYEQHGAIYYDENGTRITNMLTYLKDNGFNAMRVRLFVDPSKAGAEDQGEGVCQDLPYVTALGQRIKAAGFKLMLDIHYSDTWTDPGQHSTPSLWAVSGALSDSVYSYTKRVLNAMIAVGAEPDFIQVGNEVTYGMMWPTGHCYPSGANFGSGTFANFAEYLTQGIRACREECPNAQIIVHTEMSRVSNVTSFYNTLKDYTNDYDVIGLSYYPYWHGDLTVLDDLLTNLESSYPDKKIQIVETGYPHAYYPSDASYDLTSVWPATEAGQKAYAASLVQTINAHQQVNGLYWWFPEANEYGIHYTNSVTTSWYNYGWWDNATGQVMDALFEIAAYADDTVDKTDIYIVGGEGTWNLAEPMGKMTHLGNGMYVDTLTITAPVYFVFADGGPEVWNGDWTAFNSTYRYGPVSTTTISIGVEYPTAKRNNNSSYYLVGDGSDYKFLFDLNNLVFKLEIIEHEPDFKPGDVNEDGLVDVDDVTALISFILGNQVNKFNGACADLDGDSNYTVTDVSMLINLILGK